MQFKDGTGVYALNGQHVGHVDRVVLNPQTKEVTDIIVRKGFLFAEDKTIPLSLIATATADRISLTENSEKLDKLPIFEETHYIPLDKAELGNANYSSGLAAALYWYPPMGSGRMGRYTGDLGYHYPTRMETVQNIPVGTVALEEGARVFSTDNQHVGNITRVITESSSNRVSHFVISEGFIFKEKKLIPVAWIRKIQEGEIHLSVGTAVLEKLHEFQEA